MHTKKLLIADDHELFINGLRLILKQSMGMDIPDYVLDGKAAIDRCRKEFFDFVVMDINMPVIDGIEATREIKLFRPDTKVLIVSMRSDLDSVSRAMKAGADGFLIKNADAAEFLKAFRAIQNGQVYLSEHFLALMGNPQAATRNDYIRFSQNVITTREKSILKLICEGFTNSEIADTLSLSVATVNTHRNNMLAKLNLPNTAALVRFGIDNKLI
jgi:DNA-binding NarL/FixJ family response regulator